MSHMAVSCIHIKTPAGSPQSIVDLTQAALEDLLSNAWHDPDLPAMTNRGMDMRVLGHCEIDICVCVCVCVCVSSFFREHFGVITIIHQRQLLTQLSNTALKCSLSVAEDIGGV